MNPSKHKMTVLAQICKLIPGHMVNKITSEHGVDEQARRFSPGAMSCRFCSRRHRMRWDWMTYAIHCRIIKEYWRQSALLLALLCDWLGHYEKAYEYAKKTLEICPSYKNEIREMFFSYNWHFIFREANFSRISFSLTGLRVQLFLSVRHFLCSAYYQPFYRQIWKNGFSLRFHYCTCHRRQK